MDKRKSIRPDGLMSPKGHTQMMAIVVVVLMIRWDEREWISLEVCLLPLLSSSLCNVYVSFVQVIIL